MTTGVNRLQKHSWLRHICVSHKECEEWMDLMDLEFPVFVPSQCREAVDQCCKQMFVPVSHLD